MKTKLERNKRQDPPKVTGFPERVALFIGAVHRPRADELFAGLADAAQGRAKAFVARMQQWDSGLRQARLSHEFGLKPDAAERLKALVVRCDGALRVAVVAALPPALRLQFPQLSTKATHELAPATRALAARLVREASR